MTSPTLHLSSSAAAVLPPHDTHHAIHWPACPDGYAPPAGWTWVERCDDCALCDDDEYAAIVLILELGRPYLAVAWFDRDALQRLSRYRPGASVAIDFTPEEL